MKRKGKLPFNPKVVSLESKWRTNHFRVSEGSNCVQAGRSADAVFFIQSGKVKMTVISEQGKEAVVASWDRRFFRRRMFKRRNAAPGDSLRHDEMPDRANPKGRNHPRDPRRAGVC